VFVSLLRWYDVSVASHKADVMRLVRFVCSHFDILSVILWARLLQKWWADFIETWCYDWVYQSEGLSNFWWWYGSGYGFRITFHFPHHCEIRDFRKFQTCQHWLIVKRVQLLPFPCLSPHPRWPIFSFPHPFSSVSSPCPHPLSS